jgi:hypothetical protein
MQEPNPWPVRCHEQEGHAVIGQLFARAKCAGPAGLLGADGPRVRSDSRVVMRTPDDLSQPGLAASCVRGGHNALVALVEFGDFECPICKQASPTVLMFGTHVEGRVTLAYRHFPAEEVSSSALSAVETSDSVGGAREFCVCELDALPPRMAMRSWENEEDPSEDHDPAR